MNKDVVKMLLDSDCEVLQKAYESDKEILEMIDTIITQYVSSIFDTLVKKEVLTTEEALEIIKATNERINSGGKEDGNKMLFD